MSAAYPRLPKDAPSTPEEWRLEWRVLSERMRAEATSWPAQRWPLHEWDYEPPIEFIRELVTLWYQAGATVGALDKRAREIEDEAGFMFRPEAHPEWARALRAIDVLVSGEKSRRIRERLAAPVGDPEPARKGPPPMTTREQVDATEKELEAAGEPHGERSIARALGIGRDAVRYARGKDRNRRP